MAEPAGAADASQQGGRGAREQDRAHGMGCTDKARRALPQGQGRRGDLSRSASPERLAGRNLMTKRLSGDA
jgi:hypothetical protein